MRIIDLFESMEFILTLLKGFAEPKTRLRK